MVFAAVNKKLSALSCQPLAVSYQYRFRVDHLKLMAES